METYSKAILLLTEIKKHAFVYISIRGLYLDNYYYIVEMCWYTGFTIYRGEMTPLTY